MQPDRGRAWCPAGTSGRLSSNNATAPSAGGVASSNPYKTAKSSLKTDIISISNDLRAGTLSAVRPAQSSSTSQTPPPPGQDVVPCMGAIQLLLARYPALGPALSTLDWDEHDRLSIAALLRIIKALGGEALLRPQGANPAASSAGNSTPAHAQSAFQQQDRTGVASSVDADNPALVSVPISTACTTAAAGAASATGLSASAAAPQEGRVIHTPAAAVASFTEASTLSGSFAAVFNQLQASGTTSSSPQGLTVDPHACTEPDSAASTTAPGPPAAVLAVDVAPAAGPLSVSSAGSSRRTSLRPTLSIDISSIHVSDSSSSGEDEGSDAEPPAPAPAAHACSSRGAGGPGTCSELGSAAAGDKPAYAFQHTPHPAAGLAHEEAISNAVQGAVPHSMAPCATSSGCAGRKKHCSTPGHVLHHDMHIFSNPIAASSSDGEGESGSECSADVDADGAGWDYAAHGQHMVHMVGPKQPSSEQHPDFSEVLAGQGQHRSGSKPGRKAQTPAIGLGQPVSIFSKEARHSAVDKPHFAAVVAAEAGEAVWASPQPLLRASSSPQHLQQHQHHHQGPSWEHKLSKRPPIPGVSLSQPVSIFSGSGGSVKTGLAYQSHQHTTGNMRHLADHTGHEPEHLVNFAQQPALLSSDAGTAISSILKTGGGSRQQQLRPSSAPDLTLRAPAAHKPAVTWNKKLSKRPPTPGGVLGRPVSIFSGSGGSKAIEDSGGSSGSASDSDEEPGQQHLVMFADERQQQQQQQQHLVMFADEVRPGSQQYAPPARAHSQGSAPAAGSARVCAGYSDGGIRSCRHTDSANTAAARQGGPQSKQQQKGERQQWHNTLKKRPPTPGVSLAQPVSIFTSSSATHADPTLEGDADSHVKFAEPAARVGEEVELLGHQHAPASSTSSSSGRGLHDKGFGAHTSMPGAAARKEQSSAGSAVAQHPHGDDPAGAQHQHSWHHKLSERPPTPGISLSQPVSIFSSVGTHTQHLEDCTSGARASEGCTANTSRTAAVACKARPQTAPQQQQQQHHTNTDRRVSWGGDNGPDSDSSPEVEDHVHGHGSRARDAQVPMQTQQEQQHRHDTRHHKPATPGFALRAPNSIFSHNASTAGAAAEMKQHDDAHHSFAKQPSTCAGASKQQQQQKATQQATDRRVSWGDGPEHANLVQGSSSSGTQQGRNLKPAEPHSDAAQAAAAGNSAVKWSSSGSSEGSSSHAKDRRVSWGENAGVTSTITAAGPASSSAPTSCGATPGHPQANGVHFPQTGPDSDSKAPAASGGIVAQSSAAGQALTDPEAAPNKQQQQRQHWKGKLAVRPPTPGIGLGQHADSIFLPDDSEHSDGEGQHLQEAPAHTATAAADAAAHSAGVQPASASDPTPPAAAAGLSEPTGLSAGPAARGVLARRNPDLAAEAAQQKWQQHLTNRPPTPGSSLLQHNMFADNTISQGPRREHTISAPPAVVSDSSRTKPGPASTASPAGSGDSSPAAALTAKQALMKLNPELAAEAQQQKWQQHLTNRPPTPGASLGQHHNMFADDDAACQAVGAESTERGAGKPHTIGNATRDLPQVTAAAAARDSSTSSPSSSPSSIGSPSTTAPRPSLKAKQALLKLNPELAAEMQQQQWQQHMANRPPTPGASLLQHNIFADADSAADSEQSALTGMDGGPQYSEPNSNASEARESSSSRSSKDSASSPTGTAASPAAKQALLKLNPELAAEAQQQKWQQHMANRPPTPGASMGHYHNMFADDGDDAGSNSSSPTVSSTAQARATSRVSSPGPLVTAGQHQGLQSLQQKQQQVTSHLTEPLPGSAASALVLHNPDLALEKEVQWELKLSKRPPTPATTLGKPINIFADDQQLEHQPPMAHGYSSSGSSLSGNGASAAPGVAFGRSRSPDQARSTSNSSSGDRSGGRGSPVHSDPLASAPQAAAGASVVEGSRPGSSNPGRQRGASPLRNTTTAADVAAETASPARGSSPLRNTTTAAEAAVELAEQQERATRSPLRNSSSICDPDPSRMSPLGWRGSSTGPSPSSSTPSSPQGHVASPQSTGSAVKSPTHTSIAAAPAAAAPLLPASLPADGAAPAGKAAAAGASMPREHHDGTGWHGVQGSHLPSSGAESQPHSPSRLGRSASPSPSFDAVEGSSLRRRSASPLSRSSTSAGGASPSLDAAEANAGSLRRRSASPLSRNSTSAGGAGEGSSNGRHSSPLSRCSSSGGC